MQNNASQVNQSILCIVPSSVTGWAFQDKNGKKINGVVFFNSNSKTSPCEQILSWFSQLTEFFDHIDKIYIEGDRDLSPQYDNCTRDVNINTIIKTNDIFTKALHTLCIEKGIDCYVIPSRIVTYYITDKGYIDKYKIMDAGRLLCSLSGRWFEMDALALLGYANTQMNIQYTDIKHKLLTLTNAYIALRDSIKPADDADAVPSAIDKYSEYNYKLYALDKMLMDYNMTVIQTRRLFDKKTYNELLLCVEQIKWLSYDVNKKNRRFAKRKQSRRCEWRI